MGAIARLLRMIAIAAPMLAVSASVPVLQGCGGGDSCCKHCDAGKACGDTCIAATDTCHVGSGCACDK